MRILIISLGFQLAFSPYFVESWISKEDLCLEPGTQRVHIHMYCNLAPLRFIQNVLKVNLIRLANTETCDGAGVNDEACLCRAKSRSIARGFKACIGQSGCDIFLGYFDVVDCVKRVGVPMMLKIEYECGLGGGSKRGNEEVVEENGIFLEQCTEKDGNNDDYEYESESSGYSTELTHQMTTPNPTVVNITWEDSTILRAVQEPGNHLTVANRDLVNIAQESTAPEAAPDPTIGGALAGVLAVIITVVAFVLILRKRKRSQLRSASKGCESLPMNNLGSFPTKRNTYEYSTGWRDSLAEENTNSGYYEEIPAANSNVHSAATSPTKGTVVSGNGNNGVMRDISNHGTIYESIDDAIPKMYSSCKSQGEATHTDSVTYDDVIEVMLCYAKANDPIHTTPDPNPNCDNTTSSYETMHEPLTLMTTADETVLVENSIYEGTDQE